MKISATLILFSLFLCSCTGSSTVCNEGKLPRFEGLGEKVTVTAKLTQDTYERKDNDIHLVLQDSGCTLVAEIMYSDTELWREFYMKYEPTDAPKYPNKIVTVTGLRYYDHEHDVTGAAPNQVEIHPVLGFKER